MVCPRCRSCDVELQVVNEVREKSRKGLLYWLFIGWWLEPLLWIFFTVPKLLITLFCPSRRVVSKTVTYAVCRTCGKNWRV